MKLVVLESPFAGPNQTQNLIYARRALRHSLDLGEAPIASHRLYTQVLNDDDPGERELGITTGLFWLIRADLQVFYTDYGWSPGMASAELAGKDLDIPQQVRTIGPNPTGQGASPEGPPAMADGPTSNETYFMEMANGMFRAMMDDMEQAVLSRPIRNGWLTLVYDGIGGMLGLAKYRLTPAGRTALAARTFL